MVPITNKSDLQKLSEDQLRQEVLIPLFVAMGYNDVQHNHGPGEVGKDIVMWKEEANWGPTAYAVVVKTVLTGSAKDISVVSTQVRQALGSSYQEMIGLESRKIDRCLDRSRQNLTNVQGQIRALASRARKLKITD